MKINPENHIIDPKTLTDFAKIQAALNEAALRAGKAVVLEATTKLFDIKPDLIALVWEQYTPYFNDGEPCEFGVGEARFLDQEQKERLVGTEYEDDIEEEWEILVNNCWDWKSLYDMLERDEDNRLVWEETGEIAKRNRWNTDTRTYELVDVPVKRTVVREEYKEFGEALVEFNSSISEAKGVMLSAFGDHSRVIVTKTDIHILEYEHD